MAGLVFSIVLALLHGSSAAPRTTDYSDATSVELLQKYIQINTTTYNDLTEAVEFWQALATVADVPINVYEYEEGFPVIVMKWEGSDSTLNSIMLNSHMDVVPASNDDGWTYEPFSGYIDENNDMYGRGTQDMKSVSIQYYEALRALKADNVQLLRDVYMTLMPDEEVGADAGMKLFLKSEEFAALNVGIELDEGTSFPMDISPIFYQDKVPWQIQIDCYGVASHGSTFPETNTTATGKCRNVIDRFLKFRDEQYEIAETATVFNAGVYTSVNLNKLDGGTANNVIPDHVSLTFDIRLSTTLNEENFDAKLHEWIAEAGDNITATYILKDQQSPATISNSSNPYFSAIASAAEDLGINIVWLVSPGSTDARHVRNTDVPAFGFSPMFNTPLLLHSVDERLNMDVFTNGINIYKQIIQNLANIPAESTDSPSSYLYSTTD